MADRPKIYSEAGLFDIMLHHSPAAYYPEETHDTVQICIPFAGARYKVTRSSETGSAFIHHLGASDILVIPSHQPHAIAWESPADILSLQLSTDFLEKALDRTRLELRDSLVIRDKFLNDIAVELRRAALTEAVSPALLGSFATIIAHKIGCNAENYSDESNGSVRPLTPGERARIDEFISLHLHRPIRIAELADMVGMSQWHFLRRFSATEGVTPNAFITRRRIEKAQMLLNHSTLSVTDVALEVGMSLSHLSRTFHRWTGMSPRTFRERGAS